MLRFFTFRFFIALPMLAVAGLAGAQTPAAKPELTPTERAAMKFEWVHEGPAEKCRDHCREWISARGLIGVNTARTFAEFTRARDTHGATLVIESEGGSVSASIALGRLLRRLDITTTVGRTEKLIPGIDGIERAQLSPAAICASMCPFVVLGGARRHIPPQARVLVHQIWPRQRRDDAMAATYNAQDFVGVQRELGQLAKYVVEMGGDIDMFEISMRIPPWESLHPLLPEDLARLKLTNIDDPFAPVLVGTDPTASNAVVMPVSRAFDATDSAWSVSASPGQRGISRKHPLTIEGEPIGSFELSFTCGEQGVTATYVEERQLREDAANERLAIVSIVSGRDFGLRLAVRSSSAENGGEALHSMAQAAVPAAFIELLKTSEGRALTVGTQSLRRARTSIRPGNTGFAEGFARTLADCGK